MTLDIASFAPWFTPEALEQGLVQAGVWAPILYMVVLAGSVILPILPNAVVFFSGIVVLGVVQAVLFGYLGTLIGAALAFFLAQRYGRTFVVKVVGEKKLKSFEKRWGLHHERRLTVAIFLFRLVPLVSFDLISYLAGLTKISFARFFLATAVAGLPGTIAYVMVGPHLGRWVFLFGVAWTVAVAAILFPALFVARWAKRRQDRS